MEEILLYANTSYDKNHGGVTKYFSYKIIRQVDSEHVIIINDYGEEISANLYWFYTPLIYEAIKDVLINDQFNYEY